jgi:rhomboid family GlyGly-CTERM serine protease
MALERLFRYRWADWAIPAGLVLVMLGLGAAGPDAMLMLRFDRTGILGGEFWRLVTGHLVHGGGLHLAWNILGVCVVWFLVARDYSPRQWLLVLAISTAAADLGFLLLERDLDWYVGFSGVLHGCLAAGLVAWLRGTRDWVTWLVAGLFAAKLAWEHWAGALPFTAASISLPVVHEAHTYGAIGGVLAALWLARWPRGGASSL